MTVSVQTPFSSATAAGSATFVYNFRTLSASYLIVKVDGVTKTLTTDYTVTGVNAAGGGTVVFTSAPTVGAVVTIQRKTPFQRATDYQTNGDFLAGTVNPDFDALWMALQDNGYSTALSLTAPAGDTATSLTIPSVASRALQLLGFDALGNPTAMAAVASSLISSAMQPVVAASTLAIGRTALGSSTVGDAVFVATSADAARTVLGAVGLPGQQNLLIKNDTTTPNSKLNISADYLVLKTSTGDTAKVSAASANADITVSGAGGLDTGSEASSTWYYVWGIWNGTTFSSLLSASATAPTMPSGYTFKMLLGAWRNDGSSNFIAGYQVEDEFTFDALQSALSGGTATSITAVSLASVVPSIAKSAFMRVTCSSPASAGQATAALQANSSGTLYPLVALAFSNGSVQNGYSYGELPLRWPALASNVYYVVSTSASADLHVAGFRVKGL